ncbi:type 4b pilus protein PilO2 (plasmid) [Pseudomonas sp. FeN3W]|nr:type 4b pilus protein PilO2 [Pseudomonas sp. FeN3W]
MTVGYLIQDINPTRKIVFGIRWLALIGSNLEKQSLHKALELKSTHYTQAGSSSSAAGFVKLKRQPKKVKLYSAGAIFAQSHPNGVFLSLVELDDKRCWVIASHDGVVVTGTDIICSREEADLHISDLRKRYANAIVVIDDIDITQYCNSRSELIGTKNKFETVPLWIKMAFFGVIAVAGYDVGMSQFKKYQDARIAEQNPMRHVDAHKEWALKIQESKTKIKVDGRRGLDALYSAIGKIPLKVGSWVLGEVGCDAVDKGFNCYAIYARSNASSNRSFADQAPSGWTTKWVDLNTVRASWLMTAERKNLADTIIRSEEQIQIDHISKTQLVMAAINEIKIQTPKKINVEEPYAQNAKGQRTKIPFPAKPADDLKIPTVISFSLSSPIRTLSILPIEESTKILSINVKLNPIENVTINKSMISAKLVGEYYAQ